jgi:L-ascorbate metabolism protein UlaG (beta-lactamase superfamily)
MSDHFDGRHYRNPNGARPHGFTGLLRWQLTRKAEPWTEWTDAEPGPAPARSIGGGALRATLVNHSTVLIQTEGQNILTDPIWSERASPVAWAGPRRHRPPGIRFEDLPPVDAVLVSHNHYDHLDLPTLQRLAREHRPQFFVPQGNAALLRSAGIHATELDWWQAAPVGPLWVEAVPAQHFSARGFGDRNRALWCGYGITAPGGTAYFAGDTGYGPHFERIHQHFGAPRLAMLPIGAYLPRWFMSPVHLSPGEAVRAHGVLGARASMAIHFGTFALGDDGEYQPEAELRRALEAAGIPAGQFVIPGFGQPLDF